MINCLKVLCVLSLIINAQFYSLLGTWQLRTSQVSALSSVSTPIYFQFAQQLTSGQITNYLTITACNILTYTYQIQESQIYLSFLSIGRSSRSCVPGELVFLRTQMDQTFYFYISFTMMLLMTPNNALPIKFDRPVQTISLAINGVWIITDGVFFGKVTDPIAVANRSQISFCGGSTLFKYSIGTLPSINVSHQTAITCNQQLLGSLQTIKICRINSKFNSTVASFYDQNINLVIQMTYQSNYVSNLIINYQALNIAQLKRVAQNLSSIITSGSDFWGIGIGNQTSQIVVKTQNNNSGVISQSSTPNLQPNKTISIVTPQPQANNNSSSNTKTISGSGLTINTPPLSNSAPTTTSPVPSKTPATTASPQSNPSTSKPSAPIRPLNGSLVNTVSSIYGAWYPIGVNGSSPLNASQLSSYQIIINAARIMLNGGCNAIFSTYTFSSGQLSNLKILATSNPCTNTNDNILQNIIFNISNKYYLNNSTVIIKSTSNIPLLLLTSTAPN